MQRTRLGDLEHLAEGSQGVVYRTQNVRLSPRKVCGIYKEYKPVARREADVLALENLVGFLFGLSAEEGQSLMDMAAWPVFTVEHAGTTTGFVMPEVPSAFFIDLRLPSGKVKTVLAQFQILLNNDEILERQGVDVPDEVRLHLLKSIARDLEYLHGKGVAVGDFSPKNLLFSLSPPDTHFVDCDAMALNRRSVMPQLETPDWKVSQLCANEQLGTPASDIYKLSLLVLRLFVRDQSSTNAEALPIWVKAAFRDLIKQSWLTDPAARPSAKAWADKLDETCAAYADGTAQKARPTVPYVQKGQPARKTIPGVRSPIVAPRKGINYVRAGGTSTAGKDFPTQPAQRAQVTAPSRSIAKSGPIVTPSASSSAPSATRPGDVSRSAEQAQTDEP